MSQFRAAAFACVSVAAAGCLFVDSVAAQDAGQQQQEPGSAAPVTGQAEQESATTTTDVVHVPEAPPEAPPKESEYQLDTVQVTAQRRTEALNKVPMAISAFDQKSMEKLGSGSINDALTLAPSLQPGTGGVTIRGIGTTAITLSTPTVAIQYDGVYSDGDPRGLSSAENWDLERIEVLRGPQGTLYGRNATAGAINFITMKPSQGVEAFGDVSYKTGNEKLARFVLNEPIGQTFALRLAGSGQITDGLEINPRPGEKNGDATDTPTLFARLSARWQPMASLLWDVQVERLQGKRTASGFQADYYVSKPNRTTAIVYSTGLPHEEVAPANPSADTLGSFEERNLTNQPISLMRSTLRYQLGEQWSASLIEGMYYMHSVTNYGGLPLVVVDHTLRGNDVADITHTNSHELVLNFEGDRLHGVWGLYYYRLRHIDNNVFHLWTPGGSSDPSSPPQMATAIDIANQKFGADHTISQAAFSQVTYDVTPVLRLTGGLRYTKDKLDLGPGQAIYCPFGDFSSPTQPEPVDCQALDASGAFGGIFGPQAPSPAAEQRFSNLSWKAVVDYDIRPDLLGYATISTGYKQGAIPGFNQASEALVVKPETNINYEMGLRSELLDGRANANFTVFWMNYTDLQVNSTSLVNGAPTVVFTNVGKARARGVEAELSALLTAKDRIDSYITYLDGKVMSWPAAPDVLRGAAFTFNAKGYRLPSAPESTLRVAYTHDFMLGAWGKLSPSLSTYHSTHLFALYTDGPQDRNPAYWRSDAFLRYTTPGLGIAVEAFVNNIEDKRTKSTVFPFLTEAVDPGQDPMNPNGAAGGGIQWAAYSPGRIFGLRVGMRY